MSLFTRSSVIFSRVMLLPFAVCIFSLIVLFAPFGPTGVDARPRHHARQSSNSSDPPCTGFFDSEYIYFSAQAAYECLASAPFDKDVALEFINYYNDTLQLQSTQAYLKDPPSGYQQLPVDLFGGLAKIKDQVAAGQFKNEYDFEAAVQKLILATHDAHLSLGYGVLSIFNFGSPYDDLIESQYDDADWIASAVVEINGVGASKFLKEFAASNVQGYIEPNADWNNLMSSAASDIQGILSTFEGSSIFYPGDTIRFKFENGTDTGDLPWLAQFSIYADPADAPLITTGQELYDWYVLGVDSTPDSYSSATTASSIPSATASPSATTLETSAAADTSGSLESADPSDLSAFPTSASGLSSATPASTSTYDSSPTATAWGSIAFPPNPIVAQPGLGDVNGGVVTGYILNDALTAILSIPSFVINSENAVTFSTTVQDFLIKSKAAGCTRVIIDVQRNTGGADLLATDTFKQFFPTIDPFGAARLRAAKTADALGNTFTQYYDTHSQQDMQDPDYLTLSASVWVATDYLNAETGRNFTSWPEYFGPHAQHGDLFTTVQRDNLSSPIYTEAAAGLVVYGYANRTINTTQPFPAEDIIILSDAFCSSACARFVEMMHHEGGARTVVAGGEPVTGPMQAVGGSKGAQSYDAFYLDNDIDTAIQFNSTVKNQLPQGRGQVDFIYTYAGFNLKDAIRKGEEIPLQFVYEPADCRIFYTQNTVYNYINLWNYVIDAVYRNPSLCIAGSVKPPLAPLIIKGLSQPQTGKRKRSLPHLEEEPIQERSTSSSSHLARRNNKRAKPFTIPDPNALHTSKDDRPFQLDTCQKCKGGDVCFDAPQCRQGKLTTVATCASKCNNLGGPKCRDPRHGICHQDKGQSSGVCISGSVNDAIRECTGGTSRRIQEKSVTNPALGNFAFRPGVTRPGRR
ncbi:MAG: hypothetical protein L6R39_004148 [Caloplaca ligustica]|nr:MAG: hypothetical protein L6R39_004148 [Caloplaca ligustica]